jgi:hypothetical protein
VARPCRTQRQRRKLGCHLSKPAKQGGGGFIRTMSARLIGSAFGALLRGCDPLQPARMAKPARGLRIKRAFIAGDVSGVRGSR